MSLKKQNSAFRLSDSDTLQDLRNIVNDNGLSDLPYVDEKRNEVLDDKPQSINPSEYYQKNDTNPLLAFIEQNMKPERDEERESKLKKASTVNALGNMLRNVIDLHYGKKGATIAKRDTGNPYTDRLLQLQDEYRQEDDRYEQLRLNALMKGVDLENRREGKINDANWQLAMLKERDRLSDENAKDRIEGQKDIIDHRTNKNIEYEQAETAEFIKRQLAKVRAENESGAEGFYNVKDNQGREIQISEGAYWDIVKRIRNNPELAENDRLTNQLKRGENLTTSQLNTLVSEYWNRYYQAKDGRATLKESHIPQNTSGYSDGLYDQNVINEYQKTGKTNNASQSNSGSKKYKVGGYEYEIPANQINDFLKDFPNAKEL